MNKQERRHRVQVTLLITVVIFCIQLITIFIVGGVIYILIQTGIISLDGDIRPRIESVILYLIFVSSVIGFFVALIASRVPVKPLNYLIHQINRLASGNFQTRLNFGLPLSRYPVFSKLTDSFNQMAEELEKTEMLRGDFINNFSHEFKTPIVSIAGFAKLLRRGDLSEEQKEEYLAVIEEESLRLSYMATNVLNLTRVENQTILTDVTRYNLSEQIRSCILLLVDKWEKKGLEFNVDFREYMIEANEELLKQVWINLIDNAVKFSIPGGIIEIGIKEDADALTVHIINSGEQIPAESIFRIFQKFYQADSSHDTEGNGIGLAVVRRVVDLHGGTVAVRSENNLTMFTVVLPKTQQASDGGIA